MAFLLRAERPLREVAPGLAPRSSGHGGVLLILLGIFLGLLLAAYRALPLALGDPASFLGIQELAAGPWWLAESGPLRLPFFLGAVTLVAMAAAVAGSRRNPLALSLVLSAILLVVISPRILIPFVGIPLAFACAAGVTRLRAAVPLRVPVGALLASAFLVEAVPHHMERIRGIGAGEVARAPRWIQFLDRVNRGERVMVLGQDQERQAVKFAARGILRSRAGRVEDLNQVDDPAALAFSGARYIASDLPDARKRFPLIHVDRAEGKYIYENPACLGPAYWTQRVEARDSHLGPALGSSGLPNRMGAVCLKGSEPDLPGEAFGVVRSLRRRANGLQLEVSTPGESYLVITEPRLPGLGALVDGKPTPTLQANLSQVALCLPPGRHEVQLDFDPPGLATGSTLSALALGALPFLLAAPLISALARRNRRRRGIRGKPTRAPSRTRPRAGVSVVSVVSVE
jgi:hypothetical protein